MLCADGLFFSHGGCDQRSPCQVVGLSEDAIRKAAPLSIYSFLGSPRLDKAFSKASI